MSGPDPAPEPIRDPGTEVEVDPDTLEPLDEEDVLVDGDEEEDEEDEEEDDDEEEEGEAGSP
jgi:hypothetical protein